MKTTSIGGTYFRVADPSWTNPLDPSYASLGAGQRWNPMGIPCLYLNSNELTAKANVKRLFIGLPYGPSDIDPAAAPTLIAVEIATGTAADPYSYEGLALVGLPTSYPFNEKGNIIGQDVCQPNGLAAFEAVLDGVDCRSAAEGGDRELAWFPRLAEAREISRQSFDLWWTED